VVVAGVAAAGNRLLRNSPRRADTAQCRCDGSFSDESARDVCRRPRDDSAHLPVRPIGIVHASESESARAPAAARRHPELPERNTRRRASLLLLKGTETTRSGDRFARPSISRPRSEVDRRIRARFAIVRVCLPAGVIGMLAKLAWRFTRAETAASLSPGGRSRSARSARRAGTAAGPAADSDDRVLRAGRGAVVVGVLRPMILLPAAMISGLAPDQLEAVLTPRIGAYPRFDTLAILAQRSSRRFCSSIRRSGI